MPLTASDAVSARLDRLEREGRRWRRAALGSLARDRGPPAPRPEPAPGAPAPEPGPRGRGRALRPAGLARARRARRSAGRPTTLPASRFTTRPASRGRCWRSGAGGSPGLTLLDTDGTTVRAALVVGPDGAPGFALFDSAGKPRLAAALFHGSAPGRSTSGREPAPAIVAYDGAGVVRDDLRDPRGRCWDSSWRTAGARPGPLLRVQPDGTPDLLLRDVDGRNRAGISVLTDGTPALNLNGADGRARATMTLAPGRGAALALADSRGAVVWSAPP